jgi:hypothetical protein
MKKLLITAILATLLFSCGAKQEKNEQQKRIDHQVDLAMQQDNNDDLSFLLICIGGILGFVAFERRK